MVSRYKILPASNPTTTPYRSFIFSASTSEVCAVTGLNATFAGQGLGIEEERTTPVIAPVMTYRVILPHNNTVPLLYLFRKHLSLHLPHQLHMDFLQERLIADMQQGFLLRQFTKTF